MESTTHVAWAGFLLLGFLAVVGLALFAFWIWMLVHCLQNKALDSNEKLVWVLVIVFTHFLGAVIYFFVGRTKRLPPNVQEFQR
jgi:hypothetical protein